MSDKQTKYWRPLVALLVLALSFSFVTSASADKFPEVFPLPNGFGPEGIAAGEGTTFYVGSIPTGNIFRGDLGTGEGEILVTAESGRQAIGLKFDGRTGLLYVAGGPTRFAYIYDGETGESVDAIELTTLDSFINDVVITRDAAYFTNSRQPEIYRVPLEKDGGLPDSPTVEVIPLTGDYQFDPAQFNANGITATPNGKTLIIINSWEGALYSVNPFTGEAALIDLGGSSLLNGDGILLHGNDLYVVQNRLNQVSIVELSSNYTVGEILETITSDLFRVPTTIARFGDLFYVVNARFGTPVTPDTDYDVVRVPDRSSEDPEK
ncbi:MAG: superoxide dismutase [Chloroflexota bacterium]